MDLKGLGCSVVESSDNVGMVQVRSLGPNSGKRHTLKFQYMLHWFPESGLEAAKVWFIKLAVEVGISILP